MASKESQHVKSKEELKEKKLKKEHKKKKDEKKKKKLQHVEASVISVENTSAAVVQSATAAADQHPSTTVTTVSTDKDVAIAEETLVKLRQQLEKQRDEQRMTQLLRRKDDLAKLVTTGKLTQEQADLDIEKEIKKFDEKKEEEETPHLLVGKNNLPTSRGQQWTSKDPYNLSESEVEEVGQQSLNTKPVFLTIRINRNLVIEVKEISLGGRQNYSNGSFIGWSLKKIPLKDGGAATDNKKEKKRPFNFSGSLKCLPELHRGLRRLEQSAGAEEIPGPYELLKDWKENFSPDTNTVIDLSDYGQEKYTRKAFSFQDFRLYVDDVLFRSGASGGLITYETICLTKRKVSQTQSFFTQALYK